MLTSIPRRARPLIAAPLLLLAMSGVAAAASSGPALDHVGIPGAPPAPRDCTACHTGFPNAFPGYLDITIRGTGNPLPTEYDADAIYQLRMELFDSMPPDPPDPSRQRWGFELASILSNTTNAGLLTGQDSSTQVLTDIVGRDLDFIRQSSVGWLQKCWDFDWQAPPAGSGDVEFYYCGNAGNGDFNSTGDNIWCAVSTITERVLQLPGPVKGLSGARRSDDIEWSWQQEPDATLGYRLYGVTTKPELPRANDSTPAAERPCAAPTSGDTTCTDVGPVMELASLYYQVVGVCCSGIEGPN